ncbi:hypothetical protein [Roseobacter sp. MH60115]|uniref:hypothetical protein n=1 Tax=Roseobacter sp. MH60115 TaxID=2785324 RepID=UPI0018A2CCBA|nr:hypothetical protein [Roseobacter sp. MH60115]
MTEKLCWACQAHLREAQIRCTECDTWQNWRKVISISDSSLTVLVALFSVFALATQSLVAAKIELFPSIEVSTSGVLEFSQRDDGRFFQTRVTVRAQVSNYGDITISMPRRISCVLTKDAEIISKGWRDAPDLDREHNLASLRLPDGSFVFPATASSTEVPAGKTVEIVFNGYVDSIDIETQLACDGAFSIRNSELAGVTFVTRLPNEREPEMPWQGLR